MIRAAAAALALWGAGAWAQDVPPIEAFTPVEPPPAGEALASFETEAPPRFDVQPFGVARAAFGVDTRFESMRGDPLAENVFDFLGRARLGADVKLTRAARLYLEGRLRWRAVSQRAFDRAKGDAELSLGETFADLYTSSVDFRVGNQIVAFGANAMFAPADVLNPRDLREGLVLSELEDVKLPALGARARGEYKKLRWQAAYFPFFQPHRYDVFGQDEALLQPGLDVALPRRPDPSIEDDLQPHLLETSHPKELGYLGDFGLELGTGSAFRFSASWVWANEKLPQVRLDPELAAVLAASARGESPNPAAALSVQNRLLAGERLYTGVYQRQHIFSASGSFLLGPTQIDLDLGYSPRQTFFDARFAPVSKQAITWVAGVSPAEASDWFYAATYVGLAIPDVDAGQLLLLIEPSTAFGAARTAWLHLLVGQVGRRFRDGQLELSLRAAFEPIQRSYALSPRVKSYVLPRTQLWLAGELYQGPVYSPFGYYDRNDRVLIGVEQALF